MTTEKINIVKLNRLADILFSSKFEELYNARIVEGLDTIETQEKIKNLFQTILED